MKKILFSILLIAAFLPALLVAEVINSPDDSAGLSGKYATIGIGAAASGMANAYLGASVDAVSIFWNPAGLANMKRKENQWNMFYAHNVWLMSMSIDSLSVAKSFQKFGVVAAAISYFGAGQMDNYGVDYADNPVDLNRTFSAYTITGSIAYANSLDNNIDYGVVMNYFYDNISSSPANALAFDFGVRYFFSPLKGLSFNLVAKNLGGLLGVYTIDKELAFGALYTFNLENWIFSVDYDAVARLRNSAINRIGLEVKTPFLLTLRTGYFTDNTVVNNGFKNVTIGVGINVNQKYTVDFSYEPYGDLGNVYKASFGADF
ncbi:MAG: PorV/PorQ family protein [bacterium]